MTMFNPLLQIRRMVVVSADRIVFDEKFHLGLNIIHGENSSGKSTIMDFLFFGLGGDLKDWREANLECDVVTLEVGLNQAIVTLERDITNRKAQPLRFFAGNYEQSQAANRNEWQIYPYARSAGRESFSQMLFYHLGMPQVAGDEGSNITIHQLLRLMYSDQVTPISNIFRAEQWDKPLIRQTIGDLLCGAYSEELFEAQIRIRDAEKEHEKASKELTSLLNAQGIDPHSLTEDWLNSERKLIGDKIDHKQAEIAALDRKILSSEVEDTLSLKNQEEVFKELQEIQSEQANIAEERQILELEIRDSNQYIKSLEHKAAALKDASSTAEVIQAINFVYCPSCFAALDQDSVEHVCKLCKSPFDSERAHNRIVNMVNEVNIQIRQSKSLQADRYNEMANIERRLDEATSKWHAVQRRYKLSSANPTTEFRHQLRILTQELGYYERELENLDSKSWMIKKIAALSAKKSSLSGEISNLKSTIETISTGLNNQLTSAYHDVSQNAVSLLQNDLVRQESFQHAQDVQFSFEGDRLSVDRESFFSASSMVYLRNSFFVALWKTSMEQPAFRHPRFLMLDTVEDKGLEPERVHNFQNQLVEISVNAKVDHQLIFTTSLLSPDLEGSEYIVGRHYTHERRTLEL